MAGSDGWVDLRAPGGRLLARYDPERSLLEFRRGHDEWLIDLRQLVSPEAARGDLVTDRPENNIEE